MTIANSKNKFESESINNFPDEDEKFQEFLTVKRIKPATIENYKVTIRKYHQAIGLTPSEFIKRLKTKKMTV